MIKSYKTILTFFLVVTGMGIGIYFYPSKASSNEIARVIRDKSSTDVDGLVFRFYSNRNFQLAWLDPQGLTPPAKDLIHQIHHAAEEGLDPADYPLKGVEDSAKRSRGGFWKRYTEANRLATLDILLTQIFFSYASDLSSGRIHPGEVNIDWQEKQDSPDLAEQLKKALDTNQMVRTLTDLAPQHPEYVKLKAALAHYTKIAAAGGWPIIPGEKNIKSGERGPHIRTLRQRLIISGDLSPTETDTDFYDRQLSRAVRRFQKRHGLEETGNVGPQTLTELNVPVTKRTKQIALNMERWRWLPDIGKNYLLVNIPGFFLKVVEDGLTIMDMPIIVGKIYTPTPIISDRISYIYFHPTWTIPSEIAIKEIIPEIRKDHEYLLKNKIRILDGFGEKAREIEPTSIDWAEINRKSPYVFRQDPGPKNPLGSMKFMLSNRFDIYLHGTPDGNLFRKKERGFSHGCIRMESPIDLAEYLMKDDPEWTREKILETLENEEQLRVKSLRPLPIHILYWTAWVDEEKIRFRRDIYQFDRLLEETLEKKRKKD